MSQECQTSYDPVLHTSIWKVEWDLVRLMAWGPGTPWTEGQLGCFVVSG